MVQQTFFNPELFNLARTLVIGGDARELEQILAEGIGLIRTDENLFSDRELANVRDRCHVTLLDCSDSAIRPFAVGDIRYGVWCSAFALRSHDTGSISNDP